MRELNSDLMFHLIGYIHKGMQSNLDDLLRECVTEYNFPKQDCLDILLEFEEQYGGFEEIIEQFRKPLDKYEEENGNEN